MNKKPITWIELLKQKMTLKGKGTSIKDVATDAKKEWEQIKEGKHTLYIKGEINKTQKKKRTTKKKSLTKNKSLRKKQKGGDSCGSCVSCDTPMTGGSCGCVGGSSSKKTNKTSKKTNKTSKKINKTSKKINKTSKKINKK